MTLFHILIGFEHNVKTPSYPTQTPNKVNRDTVKYAMQCRYCSLRQSRHTLIDNDKDLNRTL